MVALWVPGPLPGMNELIKAAKSGRGKGNAYARLKSQWTETVWALAKSARLPAITRPVVIEFRWLEPDKRRDPDNVAAGGRKLILDGLVAAGVLQGDGWKHVHAWRDSFAVWSSVPMAKGPGVEVVIHEVAGTVQMEAA